MDAASRWKTCIAQCDLTNGPWSFATGIARFLAWACYWSWTGARAKTIVPRQRLRSFDPWIPPTLCLFIWDPGLTGAGELSPQPFTAISEAQAGMQRLHESTPARSEERH